MADAPESEIFFSDGCPDPAERIVRGLPQPLPPVGDDFDWLTRDYDGFRLFMMEELAARVPERGRWTPADLEVVLVEAFAAVLDQLSDMADRVAAEAYLETARRPESVRRLLGTVGHDAARAAFAAGQIATDPGQNPAKAAAELDELWLKNPWTMDAARAAGPREIHEQRRMVGADDHALQLEEHPLVRGAGGVVEWSGAWHRVRLAVLPVVDRSLDTSEAEAATPAELRAAADAFHRLRHVPVPRWSPTTTLRQVLCQFVDRYRMVGQPVILEDAVRVGVVMAISVRVAEGFFQSEVRDAVEQALGTGPGGFFEPGRLDFGETLHLSQILRVLTALDGVETVCLNRFKRVGPRWLDQTDAGRIELAGTELASCDNDKLRPERGYFHLELLGGRRG